MAEENVFIEGLGPGVPQWSTEKTLQQIKSLLAGEGALTQEVSKKLDNVVKGGQDTVAVLRETVLGAKENKKATQDLKQEVAKGNDQEKSAFNKQTGIFNSIKSYLMDSIRMDEMEAKREEINHKKLIETLEKKYAASDDPDISGNANQLAKLEAARKHAEARGADGGLVQGFGDALAKLGKIGVAAEGINAFVGQGFEDRFNLANEIRQSGLMAGFNTVQAGMLNMADMINKTGFTFGQAAEFTQKFAFAVGQRGVQASLEFADSMARPATEYEAGADMMRRFGMDFAQVANMSGVYLESLQNANMLGKLTDQQMRAGMDNFMEGVQATSNVLKVSLEDAAQMISQRLQRDDVNALLALMDPEERAQAQMGIAQTGLGQDSVIGEAILKRIASGDSGSFLREGVFQDLMSTGIGSELVPLVDQIGTLIESGADAETIQNAMASLGPEFERIIGGATAADKAIIQENPQLAKIVSEMSRMADNVRDANKGDIAETSTTKTLSDADTAVINSQEIMREATVTIEGLMNTQMRAFQVVQEKLNVANDNAIDSMEKLGTAAAGIGAMAVLGAGEIQVAARQIGTAFTDITGYFTKFANEAILAIAEKTGMDEAELTKIYEEATRGSTTDDGQSLEQQQKEEKAESKAMIDGRESLDDRKFLRFRDNDAENMFDEIMSSISSSGELSGQAKDLAELIGFNSFSGGPLGHLGENFEQNQEALLAAMKAITETDIADKDAAANRLLLLIEEIKGLNAEYKKIPLGIRSQEEANDMTKENIQDRDALITSIEGLIDALRNPQ